MTVGLMLSGNSVMIIFVALNPSIPTCKYDLRLHTYSAFVDLGQQN
jgi:hypothetical protein